MGLISDGYRFIPTAKEQRANGEMTIADQKVANGIYHHTIAGVLCSQLLPQALIGGANLLFNGSNSPDSNDGKNYDAASRSSEIRDIQNDIKAYKTLTKTNPDKAQKKFDELVTKYDSSLDKSVRKALNKFKENYSPKK